MAARKKTAKKATAKTARKTATRTTTVARKKPAAKAYAKTTRPTRKVVSKTANKTAGKTAPAPTLSAAEQLAEYQRKRDFEKTAEPSGTSTRARKPARAAAANRLQFVIQKHAASQLHYDLRLEIDGVMKSWAVPKGPSADPSVKRLAMQVEDHPVAYNTFEGTIPSGEYGGGTVMIWDNGTYEIENPLEDDMNAAAHNQYERGELKIDFHGKRIKGSYALVRTKGMGGSAAKPSWLLIKHRDEDAHPESDSSLTTKYVKSVTTNRTMDEIAARSR
jgi:bifunctional non-homologous end joining protein LigD